MRIRGARGPGARSEGDTRAIAGGLPNTRPTRSSQFDRLAALERGERNARVRLMIQIEAWELAAKLKEGGLEPRGRYWLMALGEESKHWESCHARGNAFIGWDDVGDLRQYMSKAQLKDQGLGVHDALACWEFCHVMKPGDTIFAKKGARLVLGHGIVKSDYRFDNARPEYKHVRDVEWLSKTDGVRIREKELVRKTLTDVTKYPGQVADAKHGSAIPTISRRRWSPPDRRAGFSTLMGWAHDQSLACQGRSTYALRRL